MLGAVRRASSPSKRPEACTVSIAEGMKYTSVHRHLHKHPQPNLHIDVKIASPNCQNRKLRHRWVKPFLAKGPELASCSSLLMGPCHICRLHPALPCQRVHTLPAGQNPALSHPRIPPLPTGLSPAHYCIPACGSLLGAQVSFPPASPPGPARSQTSTHGLSLYTLIPAQNSIPNHGPGPAPRPPWACMKDRSSGRKRHSWVALGTRLPASSASPFETPRELPQTRGLEEWEPLTLLGKCWVAFGACGG